MNASEIQSWLVRSIEDRHLSRNERQDLRGAIKPASLASVRELAFQLARETLTTPEDRSVLDWLSEILAVVDQNTAEAAKGPSAPLAEAYFSPGEDCPRAIERLLSRTRKTADLCVFTITDDRLSDAILQLQKRGVTLRILTDDAKADDIGSDIDRLAAAGIPLRVDRSPFHMHHKFAILDREILLTGSYNWTRSAARDNEENLIVSSDPRWLGPFQSTFEDLWKRFG